MIEKRSARFIEMSDHGLHFDESEASGPNLFEAPEGEARKPRMSKSAMVAGSALAAVAAAKLSKSLAAKSKAARKAHSKTVKSSG